jgi:hypothetical protein
MAAAAWNIAFLTGWISFLAAAWRWALTSPPLDGLVFWGVVCVLILGAWVGVLIYERSVPVKKPG